MISSRSKRLFVALLLAILTGCNPPQEQAYSLIKPTTKFRDSSVSLVSAFDKDGGYKLFAEPSAEQVKLFWSICKQPPVEGLQLKRRKSKQLDWEQLSRSPIRPGYIESRNLLDLDEDETNLGQYTSAKNFFSNTSRWNTEELYRETESASALDTWMHSFNVCDYQFHRYLVLGLAFVDHNSTEKDGYEYGLFAGNQLVSSIDTKEILSAKSEDWIQQPNTFEIREKDWIEFKIPVSVAGPNGIFGCKAYLITEGGNRIEHDAEALGFEEKDGYRLFSWHAPRIDGKKYTIEFVPITLTDTELNQFAKKLVFNRPVVDAKPRQRPAPEIEARGNKEDGITIKWSYGEGESEIQMPVKWILVRTGIGDVKEFEFSEPAVQTFHDPLEGIEDLKAEKFDFSYKIKAVFSNGELKTSRSRNLFFWNE